MGGVGYTKEYPVEKYFRDAKIGTRSLLFSVFACPWGGPAVVGQAAVSPLQLPCADALCGWALPHLALKMDLYF